MKRSVCVGCLVLVVLVVGACTSGDSEEAAAGTRDAYCPVLVELAVESARAGEAVGDDAGPNAVNRPEFERTRELMRELLTTAPDRVRELTEAASFDPSAGESVDGDAAIAMWEAIAGLAPECAGTQTSDCENALASLRQAPTTEELDSMRDSAQDECSPPVYLRNGDDCGVLSLAVLLDDGDSELPVVERTAEACSY